MLKDHLEKLWAFKTVAELGSISKAASVLNISQSSLISKSHAIYVEMENEASIRLYIEYSHFSGGRIFIKNYQTNIISSVISTAVHNTNTRQPSLFALHI